MNKLVTKYNPIEHQDIGEKFLILDSYRNASNTFKRIKDLTFPEEQTQ